MSLDHTPLDVSTLSPAVQKALGPGPARMMAARGLAPLPPADLACVLYQLAVDGDAQLAQAARATASGLPDTVLVGALRDPALDARVLDLFAQLVGARAEALAALVQNPAVAGSTIAALAARGGAREIDVIAANEQRLLRHPEIISAMYLNANARMSTVDRAVELAVRSGVQVPGIPAWDEIARAVQTTAEQPPVEGDADQAFSEAMDLASGDDSELTAGDGELALEEFAEDEEPESAADAKAEDTGKKVAIGSMTVPAKIRLAMVGNAYARGLLIRDPVKVVYMAAVKSPRITEFEAANYAASTQICDDVLRYIANKREWTKLYGTKYNLVRNPKTPLPEALRLLPFLREKDLTFISKSKGVPTAVAAQARKLVMARRSGSDKK